MTPLERMGPNNEVARERARVLAKRISKSYGVTAADILGRRRFAEIVLARHALYAELWHEGYGVAEIGRTLSRDHTTIIHGLRSAMGEAVYEAEIAKRYEGPGYTRKKAARD